MITLIEETGLKTVGANTYVSLAEADTYHTNIANEDWISSADEDRKQALVIATQSVDLLYGARYRSFISPDSKQELLFPRLWFTDANSRIVNENTIPTCLKNAVSEIALMYLSGTDVFPQQSTGSLVKNKSIKAGDISTQTEFFKATEGESFSGFRKIDIILRAILKQTSATSWRLVA